jgi:hypothetical protein
MVRLKHRYLLVNILYPEQEPRNTRQLSTPATKDDIPYTVQFRRPGPEQLSGKLLIRLIREGVADLFGDYGSGMVTGSLVGKWNAQFIANHEAATDEFCSQILLPSNKHSHHPRLARTLPHGLGRSLFHHTLATEIWEPAVRDPSCESVWNYPQGRGGGYPSRQTADSICAKDYWWRGECGGESC